LKKRLWFSPRERRLTLAKRFSANGIKFSLGAREALECGGFTPLSHSMIDHGMGKRRQSQGAPKAAADSLCINLMPLAFSAG
jgi:hypothetical protein